MVGGLTFASLTAGAYHTCGLTSGGAAYCWGYNVYGQLGDGSTTGRTAPVAVAGGLTFASLTAGRAPHLRPDERRGSVLLGLQRLRPAGRRHDDQSRHANARREPLSGVGRVYV